MTSKTPARSQAKTRKKDKNKNSPRTNPTTPVVEFNPQLKTVKIFSDGSCLKIRVARAVTVSFFSIVERNASSQMVFIAPPITAWR